MRGHRFLFGTALLATLLASSALAAPEVVVLGGGGGGDPVAACGDFAASPFEPGRAGKGVTDEQVFIDGAIAACEAALAAAPDSAEAKTWLARAYLLAGRRQDARPLLDSAVEAGNPFAAYLLSNLLGKILAFSVEGDPELAMALLVQASDAGYPPAQYDQGERYETANGVEGDYAEALRLYELASDAGYGPASYKAGTFFHRGFGVAIDHDRALQFYQRAVEQGEPLGNTGQGQMHEFGEGVAQDYAKAAEFYTLAADKGEKIAQTALAYLYEQGLGVTQDFSKSFALLVDAAAQNWGFAQAALSIHYLFGQGTEIDLTKGFDLAWSAQRNGIVYAEGILGYLYQQGMGTVRDLPNALFHYQAGADQGDQYSANQIPVVEAEIACMDVAGAPTERGVSPGVPFEALDPAVAIPACENAVQISNIVGNKVWLGRAYVKAGQYDLAIPLLEEGLAAVNPLAHVVYGNLLLVGEGLDADPARAIALYEAVASDFGLAQYTLGLAYANGTGVPQDTAKALEWFRLAESYGVNEATGQIAALEQAPNPNAIDLAGFGREGPGY